MDAVHVFADEVARLGPITHVRFNIFPDGGVSRLRLWGKVAR
jgi:allantoicase